MRNSNPVAGRAHRRVPTAQRRFAWVGLITILTLILSFFPQVVPGAPVPTASAHNLQTKMSYMFFDQATQTFLDNRIAGGWVPGTPLLLANDQLGIITKVIPRFGTTTGVGGHVDFYIPNGTTVVDVGYMIPDGSGGFIKTAMKGQSPIAIGDGPIGAKVTPLLNGLVLGPNINGVSQAAVDATSNLDRGTIAGVYGDTGIFYATSPETAWGSYGSNLTLTNNSGDVIVPLNKWDAEQLAAYGIKGSSNPSYPSSPIIDPEDGRGNAPWGLAAGLAGPESGYKWSFDLDYWNSNASDPSRMKNSIEVGPWNRIQYAGSRISFDQPGLTSTVLGYASIDGSTKGVAVPLSSTHPTTGQTDSTSPKVVRWAVGQLALERPEYVWVKVRVDNPGPGFLDASGCPFFHSGTFGGDAGGTSNGKDHLWRYYEPSTFTWNGCLAAGKPSTVEFTKPGDTIQFKIKIYNLGTQTQTNVVVKDTLPSGVTFLSAVPVQNSGPNPLVWNVGTLQPGQSFSAVVSVKVTGSGPLDNKLDVTSTQGSQTVEETVESGTSVYLVPTKTASPTAVAPNAAVTYDILVRNLGLGTTGLPVTLQEFLPPGFTYQGLGSVYVNGALVTGTTVNNTNPNKPVFTVPAAIQGAKELKLTFTALVGPTVPGGTYCNTYSVTESGIPITTGSQGCVDVGAGTIGDTIFRDWNGNGTQDAEDEGLPGVTVTVKAGACPGGATAGTATTDANGKYLVGNLNTPATYCVSVPAPGSGGVPTGYTLTADPDGAPATSTYQVALAANQTVLTADWGYKPGGDGSVGDTVFDDQNNDGVFDGTDVGINGVTVKLYEDTNGNGVIDAGQDALIGTTTTAGGGNYSFTNLDPTRSYIVVADDGTGTPVDTYFANPYVSSTGNPQKVTPADFTAQGNAVKDADFGYFGQTPGSIGDQVFIDANGNGVFDTGEQTLPNITVNLYQDLNGNGKVDAGEPLIHSASTSVTGTYTFAGLGPGNYIVDVDQNDPDVPAGYSSTRDPIFASLASAQNRTDIDFPFVPLISKSVDKATALPGDTLTYTITTNYPGPDLLSEAVVSDTVPAGTTYVPGSANAGGVYSNTLNAVLWDLGSNIPATPGLTAQAGYALCPVVANLPILDDTWIDKSKPTENNGGNTLLITRPANTSSYKYTLLRFDTISIPAGAIISSAKLGLNVQATRSSNHSDKIYRLKTAWTEGTQTGNTCTAGATWNAPNCSDNWGGGAAFSSANYDATLLGTISPKTKGYKTADVTPAVDAWVNGSQPNNGLVLVSTGTDGGDAKYYNWENTTANTDPYLKVVYYAETSGGCSGPTTVESMADTYVSLNDNTKNFGASTEMITRPANASSLKHSLLKFDLAAIPADAAISSASLQVIVSSNRSSNHNDEVRTLLTNWTEGSGTGQVTNDGATWDDSDGSAAGDWRSTGGTFGSSDYGATVYGTLTPYTKDAPETATVTGAVQNWVNTGVANYGFVLLSTGTDGGDAKYYTREDTSATNRPTLTINWTLAPNPAGQTAVRLSAVPMLLGQTGQIQVTMQVTASQSIASLTPPANLGVVADGVTYGLASGPTPAGPVALTPGTPVYFTYVYSAAPGTQPGSIQFNGKPSASGIQFATAFSEGVIVTPALSFQVKVDGPPATVSVVENVAGLEDGGALGQGVPSNKGETSLTGSIGDRVWADLNGNGGQDSGEPGLAGVQVCATPTVGSGEFCATTDALGNYRIYGLTNNGTYNVALKPATIPAGYVPTFAPTQPRTATLAGDNDADFGLQPPGTGVIGDTVWIDANEDGAVDAGETLLPGVIVKLYKDGNNDGDFNDPQDSLVATKTTDGNGYYQFTGLNPANYLVYVDEAASPVTSPYDGPTTIAAAMGLVSGNNPHQVALAAGQVYNDADFGYNWAGSIGDYVWWDNNYNGQQDDGATGIANAFVMLYFDANGNGVLDTLNGDYQIAGTFTGANGKYLFDNLPPGPYFVDVYEDSITTNGIRNIVPTTADVVYKNLGPKEPYLNADFGYYVGAKVEGNVFWDENHNGVLDGSEQNGAHLLKNVAVTIVCAGNDGILGTGDDVTRPTQDTDTNGHFAFIVPPGLCTVSYNTADPDIPPALGDKTTPVSYTFTAVAGEDWHPSFDFGRDNTGTIGDTVYNDVSGNGNQETGEPGLAGVTVRLYDSTGATLLATTATDSQGKYLFVGLPDGSYKVDPDGTTVPAGFGLTTANDPDTATVTGGGSDLASDFGYKYTPPGGTAVWTIAGIVWKDLNGNGVYEPGSGELPIPGVSVTLACGSYGTYVLTTTSSLLGGNYSLPSVPDGTTCTISVNPATLPSGAYVQTGDPDVTSPPACVGAACNNQTTVTVSGGNPPLKNFGYQEQLGRISGTVCVGDGDGFCDDPGDTPIQGVTVKLWYAGPDNILGSTDDITTTATTDLSGNYVFPNLAPGTYQVLETDLPGYTSLNDADGGGPNNITVILPLGGVITDRDFEDDRLGDVTVTKTLLSPLPGPATISDTVKFEIVVKNTGTSNLTTVPLWDYYSPACLEKPVTTPGIIVYVDNLQPDWAAPGGGGVFSAYIPTEGTYVSPGTTTLYNGREAGIIRAGYTATAPWDEGLFAFRPAVTIDAFAAGTLTYDVITQAGVNPVWMTIEIDTGIAGDRSDNTTYQHVPTSNPAGWHTVDAAAGLWQKWNNNDGDVTGNPLISLSAVAAAHPGLNVVRTYLRLGMGLSYYNGGTSTIAWVDKATLGGVTYDFVVTGGTAGTGTNPALGMLHWPNLGPLAPGEQHTVIVEYHANITDAMYWKEGGWEDYAAKGMPDFDQKQDNWGTGGPPPTKWTFCGPVAAANSLWWFDSKFEPDPVPPPAVHDGYNLVSAYGQWDDHDPKNVQPFVQALAGVMGTGANGTNVHIMATSLAQYITNTVGTGKYTVAKVKAPQFEWVESEVRRSEDVILLLGFWQELPPGSGNWERVGGHFVTVAGVDSLNKKIGFSDPYRDAAEAGGLGRILPNPHPYLHPAQPPDEVHNDAKYASHDVYAFTPSPSPGGIWGPEGYAETCEDVMNFAGQNAGDLPNGGTCQPAFPIFTEVEYAVAVSPLIPTVTCDPTTNIAVVSGAYDQSGLLLPEAQAHAQVRIVEKPAIGVAKRIVTPVVNNGDGTYTVEYSVLVQNVGNTVLNAVQVTDDLVATFAGATSFSVVAGSISATGLTANTNFNGTSDKKLLAGADSLASLTQGTITFKVLVKPGSKLGTYNNTAVGRGVSPLGATVTDDSQDGVDTDPDTSGLTPADNPNPGDDNMPTPVDFTEHPVIGIAKALDQVKSNADGTYVVTFTLTVENFGDVVLNNLVITDAITTQFAGMNPTGFTAINGTLTASATWNGTAGSNILAAGQSLAAGAVKNVKIRFTVTPGFPRTVNNTAYTQGTSPAGTNVTDRSTVGTDPDNDGGDPANDNNNNPADNNTPTPVTFAENPRIGVAKQHYSTTNQGGGVYRVVYVLTVKNYGDVLLKNVQVMDDLAATFTGATNFTAINVQSAAFAENWPGYTGVAPNRSLLLGTDTLAVGASGTITLTVDVTPGNNLGPYNNRATATGDSPSNASVSDLSQNGTDPDPVVPPQTQPDGDPTNNNDPTPVSFTAKTQIGVAKDMQSVVNNGDGTYDVTYLITVKNMGDTVLGNVQVNDNLSTTFPAPATFSVVSVSSAQFTENWPVPPGSYTGISPNIGLLLGTDTLNPGQSGAITLVVRVTPRTVLGPYNNQARGSATGPGGTPTSDNSQNGTDPDPVVPPQTQPDGDPTNNNQPTPVTFTENPKIGVAKDVATPTNNGDGSFNVTYTILVKNYGDVVLNSVQVTDSLAATFSLPTTYKVLSLTSTGFTVNWPPATPPNYNGGTNLNLLTATGNSLAVGVTKTIMLTVQVTPTLSSATYTNQARATGTSPAGAPVSDLSQNGTDPDPVVPPQTQPDGNPGNNSDPTPVTLTQTPGIAVVKTGPALSYVGDTITYTYTVTNTGNVALSNVSVSDDKCSPVTYVSGDADNDGKLDVTETWKFTCTYTVKANDPNPLVNHATAQGIPPLGGQPVVSQQVSWSVPLVTFLVGDMVWLDDGDGIQQPSETTGLYNVPISITGTDVHGNPVNITVYTDITGHYLVSTLLPGTYTATTPAAFGGYQTTTPGPKTFTLTPANPQRLDIDFGYTLPTGLNFLGFQAVPGSTKVKLTWQLKVDEGIEAPSFNLRRAFLGSDTWKQLNDALIPPSSHLGQVWEYEYTDVQVQRGATYLYELQMEDGTIIGPWQVRMPGSRVYLPIVRR